MSEINFQTWICPICCDDHAMHTDNEVFCKKYDLVEMRNEIAQLKSLMSVQLDMQEQIKKLESENEYLNGHAIESKKIILKLESENEDLKNTLNGIKNCKAGDFVVYHPVKNPDADNIFETINKLREQVKDYEQALKFYGEEKSWLVSAENEFGKSKRTIVRNEQDLEYFGYQASPEDKNIVVTVAGNLAREVLKKWSGV